MSRAFLSLAAVLALSTTVTFGQQFPFGVHRYQLGAREGNVRTIGLDSTGSRVALCTVGPDPTYGRIYDARSWRYGETIEPVPNPLGASRDYMDVDAALSAYVGGRTNQFLGTLEAVYDRVGQAPLFLGVSDGFTDSFANRISRNGDIVFGYDYRYEGLGTIYNQPFRWTQAEGRQDLGHATPGALYTRMEAISADGAVGIGYSGGAGVGAAFRWTMETGYTLLQAAPGGRTISAYDVTPDGNIIVGAASDGTNIGAAIWRDVTQPPQVLSQWASSLAEFVSQDARIVAGRGSPGASGTPGSRGRAFIWTSETGMVSAIDYLPSIGVILPPGATIDNFNYMSDDGTVLGCVIHYPGATVGALIVIPAPASAGLCLLACGLLATPRRRRLT